MQFAIIWYLTALASLIVGMSALSIVLFLLINFSNNLNPVLLSADPLAISQDLLQMIVIWPGLGFLLALMGIIAGFICVPEGREHDECTAACKWICRAGIGL